MKRLLVMLLVLCGTSLAATSIRSIRTKMYYDSVCRLVFDMDRDTDFNVRKATNGFRIDIPGFDEQIPEYNLSGTYLDAITVVDDGIKVHSSQNLAFYTLRLGDSRSIVIDFYKNTQDKASRLAIARFNADKGRLATADKDFSRLAVDYPNHYDVFYHWGILLLKRGSDRASAKFAKIPPSSSYYHSAQKLLQQGLQWETEDTKSRETIGGENITVDEPNEISSSPKTEAESDSLVTEVPQSVLSTPETTTKAEVKSKLPKQFYLYFAGFVILFIIVFLIIRITKKRNNDDPQCGIQESTISMDANTLSRMVNRLLADGWTNKEIAREMKISIQEVEQIIRRLHHTGSVGDDQ
ncbi:MAG: hypothetical protein M0Q19_00960 [Candidatus Cloacimonetes bacterium]|nr:hypothetical protein [Candidatus Cloacimonadota bacterium]